MITHSLVGRLFAGLLLALTPAAVHAQATGSSPWNTQHATLFAGAPATATHAELVRGLALRDDITLRDGTIEADIDPPPTSRFAGFAFRVQDAANYDIIYFFGDSLRWREVQYQPFYQGGPSWQLYAGPGYLGSVSPSDAPGGKPMHVRIVFAGSRADVYVNNGTTPVLSVPELKRTAKEGHVGLWTGTSAPVPLIIDHYSATRAHDHVVALKPAKSAVDGRMLTSWRVTSRLPSPDTIAAPSTLTPELAAALKNSVGARAETDGLMNLTRIVGNPGGPQVENVPGGAGWGLALAQTTLTSRGARTTHLHVGYSEGISVFLNGERVYTGTHPYSGGPDLGRVTGEPNDITFNLRNGKNDLVLAVTDRAFGWGFRARIDKDAHVDITH